MWRIPFESFGFSVQDLRIKEQRVATSDGRQWIIWLRVEGRGVNVCVASCQKKNAADRRSTFVSLEAMGPEDAREICKESLMAVGMPRVLSTEEINFELDLVEQRDLEAFHRLLLYVHIGWSDSSTDMLSKMINNSEFGDVSFDVGGEVFHGSKCILAASSPHFWAIINDHGVADDIEMKTDPLLPTSYSDVAAHQVLVPMVAVSLDESLDYGTDDNNSKDQVGKTIVVRDVTAPAFLACLKFLYTRCPPSPASDLSVLFDILAAATKFEMTELVRISHDHIIHRDVHDDNFADLYCFGHEHGLESVKFRVFVSSSVQLVFSDFARLCDPVKLQVVKFLKTRLDEMACLAVSQLEYNVAAAENADETYIVVK